MKHAYWDQQKIENYNLAIFSVRRIGKILINPKGDKNLREKLCDDYLVGDNRAPSEDQYYHRQHSSLEFAKRIIYKFRVVPVFCLEAPPSEHHHGLVGYHCRNYKEEDANYQASLVKNIWKGENTSTYSS